MTEPGNNGPKTHGRPFQPGNPGRPKGAKHKTTILAEKLMADDVEGVVKAVIDAARTGDMAAARIILDRLVPVRKGRPVEIELPPVKTAADVLAAMAAVLDHVAEGEITPDEGATVAGILEVKRRTLETVDLERRLAALETAKEMKR